MTTGPRIGSLCTGYGGLDMAVQHVLGGSLAWVSDIDPGAAAILAHHHPDVPNIGDLTTAPWADLEPVEILCGGYPCQPFSAAGKRKGTADERHIWPYIATALRVLRPRLAVFENVAGHLSLGLDVVLADLARIGFDAEWCTVGASEVGAPHQRRRVFLLATPADADGIGGDGWSARAGEAGREVPAGHAPADADRGGLPRHQERDSRPEAGQPEREPRVDPDGRGVQREAPADADSSGRRSDECDVQPRQPDAAWGDYESAIRTWEHTLGRPAPAPLDALGRLSPAFVEWMQGLPAGLVTAVPGLTRTAQLKALGNGVIPQQAAAAIRLLLDRL